MSRTELAQQRLDSYTHDMDQLLQAVFFSNDSFTFVGTVAVSPP